MLFSCKVTHSIFQSLDRRGEDLSVLYENSDWPIEFLRDPSSWLEADKMEALLLSIEKSFSRRDEADLLIEAGHSAKELRAWGVLDSVLRMVQSPKELFAQPDRFLSYFVSPAPPVGGIQRLKDSVRFEVPLSVDQYPMVAKYLRAALEALPTYINHPLATVAWEENSITISWSENQSSLFGEVVATDRSLHPELVQSILSNLESSQKELEETKKRLLQAENEALEWRRRAENAIPLKKEVGDAVARENVASALHSVYRLGDYFARGQQLVTLLIGQGRLTPQVQEAMRRVDWLQVTESTPNILREVIHELQHANETFTPDSPDAGLSARTNEGPAQARLFTSRT